MPTRVDFAELIANCIFIDANGIEVISTKKDKRVTVNDILGIYLESTINGARLFFPCSGRGNGRSWSYRGSGGLYWSSSWSSARSARDMGISSGGVFPQSSSDRFNGFALRPIWNPSDLRG